jgi:hypothetical protein
LRQLHAFLKEQGPSFGSLIRVQNKRQGFLWIHAQFAKELAPPLRQVNHKKRLALSSADGFTPAHTVASRQAPGRLSTAYG